MMKFTSAAILFSVITTILHALFIAYIFTQREIKCVPSALLLEMRFELFLIWAVAYFPLALLCGCYIAVSRMCRSCLCGCWRCCGQNTRGKSATRCSVCCEGILGNPLLIAVSYILWGCWEWLSLSDEGGSEPCAFEIEYGFLGDVVLVSASLLLLCVVYFQTVRRRLATKRKASIARKYNAHLHEDAENAQNNNAGAAVEEFAYEGNGALGGRLQMNALDREGSGQPFPHQADRRFSDIAMHQPRQPMAGAQRAPVYAQSAQGVAPYSGQRLSKVNSFSPNYAASAHGVPSYQPQPQSNEQTEEQSIEISVELDGDDDDNMMPGGHRTRGPSMSFPSAFRGHARRVSSGILRILKKIDAEPECAVCMDELEKGDAMGQLECGHTFHKDCIIEWLGNDASCPMCRLPMGR